MSIKLAAEGGTLHTLKIAWPFDGDSDKQNLAIALYSAREVGIIPSVQSVILPDGTEFGIDSNLP